MGGVFDQHCSIHASDSGIQACEAEEFPTVENRKKQELWLIFKYGTVCPSGLNQDSSFT